MEDIILADSVMGHVHGAAIHGIALYEGGRDGSDLPVFHNMTIENITTHGGDYGIFLEIFNEVLVTDLTSRNTRIDGMVRPMYSTNWKEPVVDGVIINRKSFSRPDGVHILGVPANGETAEAEARICGGAMDFMYNWQTSTDGAAWKQAGQGERFPAPGAVDLVRVTVIGYKGDTETSHEYRVFPEGLPGSDWDYEWRRLYCREMWELPEAVPVDAAITQEQLAGMLLPLANPALRWKGGDGETCSEALRVVVENGFIALERRPWLDSHVSLLRSGGHVTHQKMATVAVQACGVNYRNASCIMPVRADTALVNNNYGANVTHALYSGSTNLESDGCFKLQRFVIIGKVVGILDWVADLVGI